ncbi:MAG: hypothetical protein JOZ70_12650 [Pseudolabrys sp.]|nr:hypothetical protein [Pseudolabrys sp.]
MTEHRVYFLNRERHVIGPPTLIEADTDEYAIHRARQLLDGKDIEVWQLQRLVARIPHKE